MNDDDIDARLARIERLLGIGGCRGEDSASYAVRATEPAPYSSPVTIGPPGEAYAPANADPPKKTARNGYVPQIVRP